ncbi:hypothetical protein VTJ04DRAFT_5072 [Mycothermus thermophilus]|uniref:uncharacterized protein n=1 Tax=Humicola insolens TaxID=85995 RepID=UPI0037422121
MDQPNAPKNPKNRPWLHESQVQQVYRAHLSSDRQGAMTARCPSCRSLVLSFCPSSQSLNRLVVHFDLFFFHEGHLHSLGGQFCCVTYICADRSRSSSAFTTSTSIHYRR